MLSHRRRALFRGTIAFLAVLASCGTSPLIAQDRPARDGEIRTSRDPNGDSVTTLTLVLRNRTGPLPINMVFVSRKPSGRSGGAPSVSMQLDMPMFTGAPSEQSKSVALTLDAGTKNESLVTYTIDPSQSWPTSTTTRVRFDASDLSRLTAARTIRGQAYGLDFDLSPAQVRALTEFQRTISRR
jgi:hypothetical protein